MQLDKEERGFSFLKEGPLDMRMDQRADETAEEIINHWSEEKLAKLFKDYGEERYHRRAARAVVRARRKKPFKTTTELSELLAEELPRSRKKIHPATLIFQSLRIYINRELDSIAEGIKKALHYLAKGGRIGVISFHSMEDRIVKELFRAATAKHVNKFRKESKDSYEHIIKLLSKKPITPSLNEIRKNRRSRSAKMRVAAKVES